MSECELCKQTMFIGKCPHNRMSRMSHARDEKFEKELENDLKILALDCYDKGFKAGLKAEREKSKKLVEALSWALDSVCKHEGDSHQDTNRTWCLYCQSWVYKSDIENLKKAEAILKEYEKEGAE